MNKRPMTSKEIVCEVYPTAHVRQWGKRFQIARERTKEDKRLSLEYVFVGPSRNTEDRAWQAAAEELVKHE
jgi:hypothetical protein